MNNQTKPKLMGVADLFKDSLKFSKENIRTLIRIISVPFILSVFTVVIVSSFVMYISYLTSSSKGSTGTSLGMMDGNIVLLIIAAAFVYIILILATIFFGIASRRSYFELFAGKYTSYKEMVKLNTKTLHSLIWILILTHFMIQGGTLLLGIPGIIAFVLTKYSWFEHFSNPKDNRGLRSVINSWNITRPYFFPVLGRLLLAYLVFGIVTIMLFLVAGLCVYSAMNTTGGISIIVFTILAVVLGIVSVVFSTLSVPIVARYEWLIYRDLTKYSANSTAGALAEGGVGKAALDRKYKNRKAIAIVLIVIGLAYSLLSGVVGALTEDSKGGPVINGRCDVDPIPTACAAANLPTKLKIQRIAEGSNRQFSETYNSKDGRFSIGLLEGWDLYSDTDSSGDLLITDIVKKGDDLESEFTPIMTIVSANGDADLFDGEVVDFVKEDGKPNTAFQKLFIGGVINGSYLSKYVNKNSIYKLDDSIISMPLVIRSDEGDSKSEADTVYVSWFFFTRNSAYYLNIQSPVDVWDQYKADIYKMALTFKPLPKTSN